jgi:hypothetical protein
MAHTLDRGLCIDWIASNSRNTSARSRRDWLEQVICRVGNCSLRIKVRLGVEEHVVALQGYSFLFRLATHLWYLAFRKFAETWLKKLLDTIAVQIHGSQRV